MTRLRADFASSGTPLPVGVFGCRDCEHGTFRHRHRPRRGFRVGDIDAAGAETDRAGASFIGPVDSERNGDIDFSSPSASARRPGCGRYGLWCARRCLRPHPDPRQCHRASPARVCAAGLRRRRPAITHGDRHCRDSATICSACARSVSRTATVSQASGVAGRRRT